jgi:hypothetical protein
VNTWRSGSGAVAALRAGTECRQVRLDQFPQFTGDQPQRQLIGHDQ